MSVRQLTNQDKNIIFIIERKNSISKSNLIMKKLVRDFDNMCVNNTPNILTEMYRMQNKYDALNERIQQDLQMIEDVKRKS